ALLIYCQENVRPALAALGVGRGLGGNCVLRRDRRYSLGGWAFPEGSSCRAPRKRNWLVGNVVSCRTDRHHVLRSVGSPVLLCERCFPRTPRQFSIAGER